MIPNIKTSKEKFNFTNHITGKIAKDAIVPEKAEKNPIPNPVQKKWKFFNHFLIMLLKLDRQYLLLFQEIQVFLLSFLLC